MKTSVLPSCSPAPPLEICYGVYHFMQQAVLFVLVILSKHVSYAKIKLLNITFSVPVNACWNHSLWDDWTVFLLNVQQMDFLCFSLISTCRRHKFSWSKLEKGTWRSDTAHPLSWAGGGFNLWGIGSPFPSVQVRAQSSVLCQQLMHSFIAITNRLSFWIWQIGSLFLI